MTRWLLGAAAVLVALFAAFEAGRYSRPPRVVETVRVETRTVTEWRDREVVKRVAGPVRIVEKITETPGKDRVIERVIYRDPVTTDTTHDAGGTTSTATTAASTRVVEGGRPGWAGGLAAGWNPGHLSLVPSRVGLELDRRLVGTLWLGARASASTTFGDPAIGLAAKMEW